MVRFSDFITIDSLHRKKTPAPQNEPDAKGSHMDSDLENALDALALDEFLNEVAGSDETRSYYSRIYQNVVDIRKRLLEGLPIDPAPAIGLFRHVIENHLVDDLFSFAIAVPDHLGSSSSVVSSAIARLKMGEELGHVTERVLKSGFAALLQIADIAELPDYILQEGRMITPEEIAEIKKRHDPTFELPTYITALHRKVEGDHKVISSIETAAHENEEPISETARSGLVDDTETGRAPAEAIRDHEHAYKELAGISARRRSLLPASFWAIVVAAAAVVIALWLTGVLPVNKKKGPEPVSVTEIGPSFKREKITKPPEVVTPEPAPAKEEVPGPESQPAIEAESQTAGQEKAVAEIKPTEVAPVPETAAPEQVAPEPAVQKAGVESTPTATEHYPYTLHMGSHKSLRQVERSSAELKKKGLSPYWLHVSLPDKGKWYRLFIGTFRTKAEADDFQKAHGIRADRILMTPYSVRIGSFTSKEESDQKMSSLRDSGYCPYIIEQNGRYDLLVGAYQTRLAAEQLAIRLRAKGIDCEMILR
ncbi:hypothetical protein PITCH_A1070013 [uncultured Desulfobacterium sp.]|uniref:SPOR domain-containing protein n=1 Tax=uncultured Desulfobacterium sp. TaxID=201089 RepID=A0A445MR07_9BACT|nr:hypothetical protein PITCH_A1070013 [uncultured Desulfobacterium sp.]